MLTIVFMWQRLQQTFTQIRSLRWIPIQELHTGAAQTICAFAVSGISGSGKSAERQTPSCSYGTYGISGSFSSMAYMVQAVLAKKWFPGEKKAQGIYLLLAACICSFSGYSVYNAGNFQMVRIWQGKAVLASVLLPYLLCLCISFFLEKKQEISWVPLVLANISCCLLSSMGVILAPLLTGCFFIISLIVRRDWKRVLAGFLCCLPSIALGIVYILMG